MLLPKDIVEERDKPRYPLMRVTTLGEFTVAHALATTGERPRYRLISNSELGSRKAALLMLKILICSPHRRSTKTEIIKLLWPTRASEHANHALDTAASTLRRHILALPTRDSLLQTQRLNGETYFMLAGQPWLWVDADALVNLASTALRHERQQVDPLPYLEAAHALIKGEFLEDDLHCSWTQLRRQTIEGAKRRILYHLVAIYTANDQQRRAEELLFTFLQHHPEDEDALCHLMHLLVEQGRRQEALTIYNYSTQILQELEKEPAYYTRELAHQLQNNCKVREKSATYRTTPRHSTQTLIAVA
ncbi:hypothetical protein KDW_19760 [Dictyobacter vulcani]|uniref:Bacterial transcriptional activator domain-containing protein n=1 Tax=Dictyobacter vulcani TaxID=2607529 RepID=A0A5J4KES4_9CHLR|nr:bacterial transcriptional activator domain-containing protein [Dictyobacter vulcani]GER87814.1 hypothetical protein KDW_19760 [Dictyobacter vulcani]